jgi:hypothetical protein
MLALPAQSPLPPRTKKKSQRRFQVFDAERLCPVAWRLKDTLKAQIILHPPESSLKIEISGPGSWLLGLDSGVFDTWPGALCSALLCSALLALLLAP